MHVFAPAGLRVSGDLYEEVGAQLVGAPDAQLASLLQLATRLVEPVVLEVQNTLDELGNCSAADVDASQALADMLEAEADRCAGSVAFAKLSEMGPHS